MSVIMNHIVMIIQFVYIDINFHFCSILDIIWIKNDNHMIRW